MLLLEFLCRKASSDQVNGDSEESYLVGVWVNRDAECEAFELAVKELWSRGFVVLRVRGLSRWSQRTHSSSRLMAELWDQAERTGLSILVAETSVRFDGSKIRGAAKEKSEFGNQEILAGGDLASTTGR